MSIDHPEAPRPLPDRPNLRHLKDQAKDLLKTGAAASITDAQFKIARLYGFASWPKLKAHIDSLEEVGQLKQAIDTNDVDRVKTMMTRNPALHSAPLGYGKDGPLTWVAECRVPWESPSPARLAMADVDARARVGRAPGRRRTADASRAQWLSHPDDGAARVARCGCERPVARTFPHHLCPLRVIGSGRSQVASRSRRKSELSRPWVPDRRPFVSRHGSRLRHRLVRAFPTTTERLHRHPSRCRWRNQVRRARSAATAPRPARSSG